MTVLDNLWEQRTRLENDLVRVRHNIERQQKIEAGLRLWRLTLLPLNGDASMYKVDSLVWAKTREAAMVAWVQERRWSAVDFRIDQLPVDAEDVTCNP